jgi:hypothetical protein
MWIKGGNAKAGNLLSQRSLLAQKALPISNDIETQHNKKHNSADDHEK